MANSVNRNVVMIDTGAPTDITLTRNPSLIMGIEVTPSADAGGTIVIRKDSSSGQTIINILLLDKQTRFVDYSMIGGIVVGTTINVTLTTITKAHLYGVFE